MENTSRTPFRFLKFFGPSLCGILLFLVLVPSANGATLIINIIINKTKELMGETLIPRTPRNRGVLGRRIIIFSLF